MWEKFLWRKKKYDSKEEMNKKTRTTKRSKWNFVVFFLTSQKISQEAHDYIVSLQKEKLSKNEIEKFETFPLLWSVTVETISQMTSDEKKFNLKDQLKVELDGEIFWEKKWDVDINRSFVWRKKKGFEHFDGSGPLRTATIGLEQKSQVGQAGLPLSWSS